VIGSIPAPLFGAADVSAAAGAMSSVVRPLMLTLSGLASLVCTFFLVQAGIAYTTSSGNPEKLAHAKIVLRNSLLGLVIVLSAASLTTLLTHAYSAGNPVSSQTLPPINAIATDNSNGGLTDVLLKAITSMFRTIITSAGKPFIAALKFFTTSTPLMANNNAIFKFWGATVAMADALFVLVLGLLGFHVMSAESLGVEEIDFKKLVPKIALTFLLVNTSIFGIDAVISLSNGMISTLNSAFGGITVLGTLSDIISQSGGLGIAALLIMVVFLILTVILLVYYVTRLVVLYLGTILSPLIILLYLVPAFRDFVSTAIKQYVTTIFVLFVHVVILLLAAILFEGFKPENFTGTNNPLMSLILGIGTLLALLRTQGIMQQWSYASIGPNAFRKMGRQFSNDVQYVYKHTAGKPAAEPSHPTVTMRSLKGAKS
jgi:hypothetical protein